ncbi:hypothetical protein [Trichocoleus sp. FACHB-90]|nr:hypothetical protein [Trichocoleus sp. FACHB-90]
MVVTFCSIHCVDLTFVREEEAIASSLKILKRFALSPHYLR